MFFGQFRSYLWSLSNFSCSNFLLSPNTLTWGHWTKIEWFVADVAAVESPDRAECAMYFGGDFCRAFFWPIQVVFVVEESLCCVGTPS